MPHAPQQILLLGKGPEATGLVALLAKLPGVKSVRQQASYTVGEPLPKADLCLEMLEGIAVAYAASQQALTQGMGIVIGSAGLAALHGATLNAAARGQGAYFAVAAHSFGVLPSQLQAAGVERVLLLPDSAPQKILRRMAERGETLATASAELQRRSTDLIDSAGKETHARAHALFGAWHGQWLNISHTQRTGLDAIEPWQLRAATSMGYTLAYGAEISAQFIRTGLMALPPEALIPHNGTETLVATSPYGTQMFGQPTASGLQSAMLGAVQRALSGTLRHDTLAPLTCSAKAPMQSHSMVFGPLSARRALAQQGTFVHEESSAQGFAALMQHTQTTEPLPQGCLSLLLPFAPAVAPARHLRLVG